MLQVVRDNVPQQSESSRGTTANIAAETLTLLRRHAFSIALGAGVGLLLGGLYLLTATPQFQSSAQLIIDTRSPRLMQAQAGAVETTMDGPMVESQVQLLRSENVALAVIRDLRLTQDSEFVGGGGMVSSMISSIFGTSDTPTGSETQLERTAIDAFQRRLSVRRVGLSYVIEVGFRSSSADKAAQIANAVAEAYITDQLESKYQTTRRASVWMQDRIQELRDQARSAAMRVEEFRTANNIIGLRSNENNGGMLIGDQQLGELNSQLVLSRAQVAEARARLDRIEDILRSGDPEAAVADVLRNEVVSRLRQQYLDAAKREAEWSSRFGRNHQATINLRREMAGLQRSLWEELRRTAETFKSDFEIARVREDAIQRQINDVVNLSRSTSNAQIQLRDLESNAQTLRGLHDSFLQRYTEALQQQSFPITEARVITSASASVRRASPNTMLSLGSGLAFGLAFGVLIAFLRDRADRTFRTVTQIESALGFDCLGLVPLVAVADIEARSPETWQRYSDRAKAIEAAGGRPLPFDIDVMRYATEAPFSRLAETMRSVRIAIEMKSLTREVKVIGMTSAVPNEGKSTSAANLAMSLAASGRSVVLMDCDLRNPSMTRRIGGEVTTGLLDVLAGRLTIDQVALEDPVTGLKFVPAVVPRQIAHTSDLLASVQMERIFAEVRKRFDYVVLDLPPLAPVVDVRAVAAQIDAFTLVVSWGSTKTDVVREALGQSRVIEDRILGVILNKVDFKAMAQYDVYRLDYYYNQYYARYGYTK